MSTITTTDLAAEVASAGFTFVPAADMHLMLADVGSLHDWLEFAASWEHLVTDSYMADGGRYRRRRHGAFRVAKGGLVVRQPHQPHWQGLDFNSLNGGVERWFAPIEDAIGRSASLSTIIAWCERCFGACAPLTLAWRVEVHQFRIEARSDVVGLPTPEGMHSDGVDYVLVLLINRANIASGTTTIADIGGGALGSFTLSAPCDAALVEVASVLASSVRPGDVVARLGGDEFAVLLRGRVEDRIEMVDRLRSSLQCVPVRVMGGDVCISASVGVAEHTGGDPMVTLRRADEILRGAKSTVGSPWRGRREFRTP